MLVEWRPKKARMRTLPLFSNNNAVSNTNSGAKTKPTKAEPPSIILAIHSSNNPPPTRQKKCLHPSKRAFMRSIT